MPEVPRKRQVWNDAREADAAWSRALATHRSTAPGTPGLQDRLTVTAAAASGLAQTARAASDVGLAWAPVTATPAESDTLPGELQHSARWLCPEWVAVERAETRAASAARDGAIDRFADALDGLAAALSDLAEIADLPHRPPPAASSTGV